MRFLVSLMIDKHRLQRHLFAASASRLGIYAEHLVPVLAYGDHSSLKPLGRLYAVCKRGYMLCARIAEMGGI